MTLSLLHQPPNCSNVTSLLIFQPEDLTLWVTVIAYKAPPCPHLGQSDHISSVYFYITKSQRKERSSVYLGSSDILSAWLQSWKEKWVSSYLPPNRGALHQLWPPTHEAGKQGAATPDQLVQQTHLSTTIWTVSSHITTLVLLRWEAVKHCAGRLTAVITDLEQVPTHELQI